MKSRNTSLRSARIPRYLVGLVGLALSFSETRIAQAATTGTPSLALAGVSNSASLYILTTPDGANIPAGALESNFPLLIRLNSENFNFTQAQSDGRDIRFTTAAGVPMAYEIEQWDSVAQTAAIWVRIPEIRGNARQEIKMFWGNANFSSESSGANVFNNTNGYASVMHMNETVADSVGNLNPTNDGTTLSAGMIGKSRNFTLGNGVNCGSGITTLPNGSNPHSTEAWFKASVSPSLVVGWGVDEPQGKLLVQFDSPPHMVVGTYFSNGDVTGTTPLAAAQWIHVAHTYVNGQAKLYVNGVLDGINYGGAPMNINSTTSMQIGGFYGQYDFAGNVDEVRISRVNRSANWVKMEYENQKAIQTLVGNLVQPGATFAVTPTAVSILEGATTVLTGKAGGAQKVYWIEKRNGVDTVLATDQFTLPVSPGRVTGNQSYTVQFKAIYPTGPQTVNIPITVTKDLPDPVFTLTGPNTWDGRQPITLTPNISNLATLQAKGVADMTYNWSVGGVAAAKTVITGTPTVPGVLTLTRSQGSGPMTVTLVLNNGGSSVTVTKTIMVTEPTSDPYVVRKPGANEIPVKNQFYARDNSGKGQLYYNGTQTGAPTAVFLKVYTMDAGDVLKATYRQPLAGGKYAFTVPLTAGRVTYKVVYGTTNGGVDTNVNTVTDLVCGDAYIFEGQSNALATDSLPADGTSDSWVHTYGNAGGGWGKAVRNGTQWTVGYFAFDLAIGLSRERDMPICILNGAVGGTRIDQHQANPVNHADSGGGYLFYANLLNRVIDAKLTHGIRGIFWHQGESNSGANDPSGDYDYKSYQKYFVDMASAWKQDYPNLERYIVFQVMPKPCSLGPKGDQLREVQRTLPSLFSKMDILNTLRLDGYIGCHFTAAGYQNVANRTLSLVKQRYYGVGLGVSYTAPVLQRAYFTNNARTAINLVFDQPMSWSDFSRANFYLDDVANKVASGSVTGNTITLQLSSPAAATTTLDYLKDDIWNVYEAASSLLTGANAIPALTFADVPIALITPTTATSYFWNSTSSGNWGKVGIWTPGALAPAGQASYILNFNAAGSFTANNEFNDGFRLNRINFASSVTLTGNSLVLSASESVSPLLSQNSVNSVTVANSLSLDATTTLGGSGSGQMMFSGIISGSGDLIKSCSGRVILNGVNTYSGGTTVNAGELFIGTPLLKTALGSGPVTLNTGSVLELNRVTMANILLINDATLAATNGFGDIWSGPISLSGTSTFDLQTTGYLNVSGVVNGSGVLKKVGNNTTLLLSGTGNTYSGGTIVSGGTLSCSNVDSLGQGPVTIARGAKLDLAFSGSRQVSSLILDGIAQLSGTYGSDSSPATNKNSTYFSGSGTITISALSGISALTGVTAWGPNRVDTFAIGADKTLYWRFWNGSNWGSYSSLSTNVSAGVGATNWGENRLDAFYTGSNGSMRHKWYTGNWSVEEDLGGILVGAPAATSWATNRIDVFCRGTDNRLYWNYYNGSWSTWMAPGTGADVYSSPAVTNWGPNRLDVFYAGINGSLRHKWYTGSWSLEEDLGGVILGGPSAVAWNNSRIDVIVRGTDNQLYWNFWNGSSWVGFNALSTFAYSDPTVTSRGSGAFDIFYRGANGALKQKSYNSVSLTP